jgi:hypothetical protein
MLLTSLEVHYRSSHDIYASPVKIGGAVHYISLRVELVGRCAALGQRLLAYLVYDLSH